MAGAQTTRDISRINSLEKTVQNLCSELDSLLSVQKSESSNRDIHEIGRGHAFYVRARTHEACV